jgi:hypothetical protein
MPAVAARLRTIFARWGLPERIRVDNGHPWGLHPDLPQDIALWWLGLGVAVIWNHPRHPQENGVVERAQSLTGQWSEPAHCGSYPELQARLNWVGTIQREQYPAADGQSRAAAYPALSGGGRPYDPEREASTWDLQAVCRYLGQGVWRRRVDKAGKIYLYNHPYQAGERRAGQWVNVRFDADQREWVLLADGGEEIHRYPAEQIRAERIRAFNVSHRKYVPMLRGGLELSVGQGAGQRCVG